MILYTLTHFYFNIKLLLISHPRHKFQLKKMFSRRLCEHPMLFPFVVCVCVVVVVIGGEGGGLLTQ